MEHEAPLTLGEAMATEPNWLQAWVLVLVVTHLAAVFFVAYRKEGKWLVHYESLAIVASFMASGAFMNWLYGQVGYVRLLGLAHLVFWTPAFVWILTRRKAIGFDSLFGKYIAVYLVVAGVSLGIDLVDVIRYFIGDGELLHRWA